MLAAAVGARGGDREVADLQHGRGPVELQRVLDAHAPAAPGLRAPAGEDVAARVEQRVAHAASARRSQAPATAQPFT